MREIGPNQKVRNRRIPQTKNLNGSHESEFGIAVSKNLEIGGKTTMGNGARCRCPEKKKDEATGQRCDARCSDGPVSDQFDNADSEYAIQIWIRPVVGEISDVLALKGR